MWMKRTCCLAILYIYKLHNIIYVAISATYWVTAACMGVCCVYACMYVMHVHVIESDDIAISTNTSHFYKLHEGS